MTAGGVGETFRPGVFVDAVRFVADNPGLILDKTAEHLELSAIAISISLLVGLPVGVILGHLHRGSFVAINLGNVGRALPSLAVIAFGLAIFGIGRANVVFALVVLAVPPIVTNAFVAVDEVDPDAVEAARGMGMSPAQVLWRVELPLALPLVFAGIRTASLYVVATATLAGIVGGGGLGDIIVNQASYRLAGVVGAALCVSALALAVDAALAGLQRAVTPPGLRARIPSLEPDTSTSRVAG
ncbi:MAG TPA: ABC transporter permease [Gaiellaceae bacterium]|nr:ABC transporter permease [Gaiellaceae bacterium]